MASRTVKREPHDTAINLRAPKSWRDLVDRAAGVAGKSRAEFIVESARTRAIDVLLGQRLFALGPKQYEAFMGTLDAPPTPNEKLRKLMKRRAPWER